MSAERLADADRELLRAMARRVAELRLEAAAILTLESVKPLALLGSQAMHFFQPFASALFHLPRYQRFAELVEDRENLELLTRMIEEEAEAREARRRAASPGRSGTAPRT